MGSSPMRVVMVTSWKVADGVAHYAEELVQELRQSPKCQLHIIPAGTQVWGKQGRRLGLWWERSYWREVADATSPADLIHIQFVPHSFGGFRPFRNLFPFFVYCLSRPVIVTVHEIDLWGSPLLRALKRAMQKRWFQSPKVRCLVTLTNFVASQLRHLGYQKVETIPMWVPSLPNRPDKKAAKERLGLVGKFVIVGFGFIVARKGYEILVKAMTYLPRNTLLVLAGGRHPLDRTDYYNRLMRSIAFHPCRNRIFVTGYLPDEEVDWWLAAADVIAAPFRHLSGSASLFRALAHRKPIVASDLPPLRELANASHALLLVPPDEFEAFLDTLSRLHRDKSLERRLKEAAENFAMKNTVTDTAHRHLALYEKTLQNERGLMSVATL